MGGNVVFSSLNGLGVKVELPRSKRLANILSDNECFHEQLDISEKQRKKSFDKLPYPLRPKCPISGEGAVG